MNRHVALVLAAVGFGLLLSGMPVAAQSQGNGTFGFDACAAGIVSCPLQDPNVFGACVSFANVCFNAGKTINPQLFQTCCVKCVEFADLCGISHAFCNGNNAYGLDCTGQ